jgi:hypothetical protein
MSDTDPIYEVDEAIEQPDPDEVPIRDRRLFTQPYDLPVQALMDQIEGKTIFLRPLSDRPTFQRRYAWTNTLVDYIARNNENPRPFVWTKGPEKFQRIIEATKEYQAMHPRKPRKHNRDHNTIRN